MTERDKLIKEFEEKHCKRYDTADDAPEAFINWLISKLKSLEDEVESLKEENANLGATNETPALTGWICPRCDNSNHPFVTVCSCGEEKR